jgi:oligopeptide/dipeptide ABC transporter ATP-binding protein
MLAVDDLRVRFTLEKGIITVVDGVNLTIHNNEVVARVGESGSGKSVTALSLLRLLACPPGKIQAASALFTGSEGVNADLAACSDGEIRKIRGNKISMIFQEPMTSLNPTMTIGRQITEVLCLHKHASYGPSVRKQVEEEAALLLSNVGLPEPKRQLKAYPHQLSGGMRQRAMIAMALACHPDLLIADEPTTALDVTIQAQIMELIQKLQRENRMAVLLITHNLGIVADIADTVMVMYAGQIVEQASAEHVFTHPRHPYTRGLLASVPQISGAKTKLTVIPGTVPSPYFYPQGCRFRPRCPHADQRCQMEPPILQEWGPAHLARCHYGDTTHE